MKRSKYGNKKTFVAGFVFDSKRESTVYTEHQLLEKAGEISDLKRQEKFNFIINGKPLIIRSDGYPNGRQVTYSADMSYLDKDGIKHVIDVKGVLTDSFKIKAALMEACNGIIVEVVK